MHEPHSSHFPRSGQNLPNHFSMHIGQSPFDAVVVEGEPLVIKAKQVQNGRVKIVNGGDVLDRFVAKFISRPKTESTLHPRAGKPDSEALGIMIATTGIFLKSRHPAKLSD